MKPICLNSKWMLLHPVLKASVLHVQNQGVWANSGIGAESFMEQVAWQYWQCGLLPESHE